MAYTTINKHTDNFNTKIYSGNGSTQSITGVGFQPDLTWIKERSGGNDHNLYDAVRGATKAIASNDSDALTRATGLTAFDSDGYSLGSDSNAMQVVLLTHHGTGKLMVQVQLQIMMEL